MKFGYPARVGIYEILRPLHSIQDKKRNTSSMNKLGERASKRND